MLFGFINYEQIPSGTGKSASSSGSSSKLVGAGEAAKTSTMSTSQLAGEAGPSSSLEGVTGANAEKIGGAETPEADSKKWCSPSSKDETIPGKSAYTDTFEPSSLISGKTTTASEKGTPSPKQTHRKKSSSLELPRRLQSKEMLSGRRTLHDVEAEEVDIVGIEEDDDGEDIVIGKEITCSKCLGKSLLEVILTDIISYCAIHDIA